ncbi:M15 family metallopeptidase [Brucella intermedia]|uniref:M15 family metallopeptidase n=1 Tax=Brucella intermedia TaxID=94625 RepID=UPI00224B9BF1|nr:M15 family metallopeptidase [Brucella intermedia]
MADLAEGLAAFDSGLNTYLNSKKADEEERLKAQAVVDFNKNNQMGWAEAVRQGKVPADSSPIYMEWYKKQQGNLAGVKLRDKFLTDYQQWEGRNSADQAGYSKFVSDWVASNVGDEQDADVLRGLAPHLDALSTEGYDLFARERTARIKEGARATSGALLTDSIVKANGAARAAGTDIDQEALWQNIITQREEAVSRGELGSDFDKLTVDSILLEAERQGDESLLKLLDKKLPGSEFSMSYDPEVRAKIEQTRTNITNGMATKATREATLRERQEKIRAEELWGDITTRIHKGEEVPEESLKELTRYDGQARHKVAKMQSEMTDLETDEDPSALLEVYTQIDQGAGTSYVLQMREKGVILKPETLTKALDRVKSVQKAMGDGGVFQSPTFKDTVKFITNQTGAGDFSPLTNERTLSEEGMEALYDYRNMILDWETKNPNATMMDKEKAAKEIGDVIRSRLQADPQDPERKVYESETDRQRAQEEASKPQPVTAEPQEQPQEEQGGFYQYLQDGFNYVFGTNEARADNVDEAGTTGRPAPALDTLPPQRQEAIKAYAQKNGITPEAANQRIFNRMLELGGTPKANASDSLSDETRTKLTGLFQDPPKVEKLTASNVPVKPILDLLGHTEGTDKGAGYNETLGYGAYTGGPVNLTEMTLGDIDKLQTRMLRHPDNTWNSSAVGRYQVVRTTLRKVKKELGLTDDMKFTREVQDRIAMQLLEGRGLSKWQSGQMSDEQFINNLALEWASLPKSNGRGAYKGQRAATKVSSVINALRSSASPETFSNDETYRGIAREGSPLGRAIAERQGEGDPYANIPDVDSSGQAGQRDKFRQWNPDPIGNHEENLRSINPTLAQVVTRAQELADVRFVIGSGKRDADLQKKAKSWGWSKTDESDHLHGGAVDLWPIDENGAVKFDPKTQTRVVRAMKQAAKELGVKLDVGADWKSFKDLPHFAIKS